MQHDGPRDGPTATVSSYENWALLSTMENNAGNNRETALQYGVAPVLRIDPTH